jgi:hypothetical protein
MKQYLTTVFFVKSLRGFYPEITDEEIADELFKAKDSIKLKLLQQKRDSCTRNKRKTTTTSKKKT